MRKLLGMKRFLQSIRARGFAPQGVVDVGANRGLWSTMAKSVFPKAAILMIEPQMEMKTYLENVCQTHPSVEYVLAGAGRESGERVQTIWEDFSGSSFLPLVCDRQLAEGTQRMTPMVTIDELLEQRATFSPDLVKLDIQGFELEALAGGASLFGRTEVFILETSLFPFLGNEPLAIDCINFMSERGYELYELVDVLRRPFDNAVGQMDIAFVLRNGWLRSSSQW